ncbi:hypothetical protein F4680DRAFT_428939 [Xylaria scruposa]|nr:hypothetical protein F4680DRAFT_428939 [Xylaria scruposa]
MCTFWKSVSAYFALGSRVRGAVRRSVMTRRKHGGQMSLRTIAYHQGVGGFAHEMTEQRTVHGRHTCLITYIT